LHKAVMLTFRNHFELTPGFSGACITWSLVFCVCFVDRSSSFCPFVVWPLCCRSFFNIRILITSLWHLQDPLGQ
jgi:hypothetical protein